MKQCLATFSLIFMIALVVNAQEHTSNTARTKNPTNSDSWVTLNSDQGKFSVLMPELVKDQSETTPSPNGPYTTHLFIAKTPQGIFLVGWVDYDPAFNFGVQSELEANRDNFVKGAKATLLNTSKITMNGYPGLEFTAETSQISYKSRVYIVGRRPYQLITGTYKGQDDSYNVARFFNSFQLNPR
jgi:hypothetical protein